MIKFLFLLILVLFIFLLIYIIKNLKSTESLENYQRLNYNDNGEVLQQGLYLKQTPLVIYRERERPTKVYTILGENSKQNRIILGILNKFFKLKSELFTPYKYTSNDILKKVSSNEFDFGIIDESSLLMAFTEFNKNNFIYDTKYNILDHYSQGIFDTSNIRYVCSLYNIFLTLISSASSNIISSTQILRKHKIGVVKNSIDHTRLKQYLRAKEISIDQVVLFNNLSSMFKGLEFNRIDILFLCCGHPIPRLEELLKKKKFFLLDCSEDLINEKIFYFLPGIKKNIIPKEIPYNGLNKDIVCLSIKKVLITNTKTNKWTVLRFLYNFFNNLDYIGKNTDFIFENGHKFPTKTFVYHIDNKIKYHEGAQIFYKNQGLITNTTLM